MKNANFFVGFFHQLLALLAYENICQTLNATAFDNTTKAKNWITNIVDNWSAFGICPKHRCAHIDQINESSHHQLIHGRHLFQR